MTLVVGLTGGIGSGKSTVADLFSKKGIVIIDADQLAREFTRPGTVALEKMTEKFGADILLPDHSLDRPKLHKLIFIDTESRRWLERLLHPLIRSEIQRLVQKVQPGYCIVVIPLLLETKPNPLIQRILIIDTEEQQQIARVKDRDHLREAEIKAVMDTQVTRQQRLSAADDIIYNSGTFEDLVSQVDKLHEVYSVISS
jgi:dephospho-CoA kinase